MKKVLMVAAIVAVLIVGLIPAMSVGADGPKDTDNPEMNDPTINDWANACLAGGTLEGRCEVDFDHDGVVDENERNWTWDCGWYLIRFEYGLFSAAMVPQRCEPVMPRPSEPDMSVCYDNALQDRSFEYSGVPNQIGNVEFYDGLGCQGDGTVGVDAAVIVANSESEGLTICQGLFGTPIFYARLSTFGWTTPKNVYGCEG